MTKIVRRFNYTTRAKILQKDIVITLLDEKEGLSFKADLTELALYKFPEDSSVFVEAYRQTEWKRFSFGKIGAIKAADNTDLSMFGSKSGILFRVKVTDEKTGILIAEADHIHFVMPDQQENPRLPLLPVCPRNLGDQIYRVDYSGHQTILEINVEAISPHQIAHDPGFIALAYPAIVREILTRILIIEDIVDITEDDSWESNWLRFANSYPSVGDMPTEKDTQEKREEWIENVVSAFCRQQRVRKNFSEVWSV